MCIMLNVLLTIFAGVWNILEWLLDTLLTLRNTLRGSLSTFSDFLCEKKTQMPNVWPSTGSELGALLLIERKLGW